MKVAFIARPNLYSDPGGDTVQINNTAKHLRLLNVMVDICLSDDKINYEQYDLLHLFNVIDCEDHIGHIIKSKKPYVVSPIYVNYTEYDRHYRTDLLGWFSKIFSGSQIEYGKTIAKFILKNEPISSWRYFVWGHKKSIVYILKNAKCLLPNSNSELHRIEKDYGVVKPFFVVPCAVDTELFNQAAENSIKRNPNLVLCVGRIEGRKNIINLIRAIKNTNMSLRIIGNFAVNQKNYANNCKKELSSNIEIIPFVTQEELKKHYLKAKVHILPSWFETAGLSSLEAAAMGCNVVVSDKGDVRDYFGDLAYYCDPGDITSIAATIKEALSKPVNPELKKLVLENYTWQKAATQTLAAYKKVLGL